MSEADVGRPFRPKWQSSPLLPYPYSQQRPWFDGDHTQHRHGIRVLGEADLESAQLALRPRLDRALYLHGHRRWVDLAEGGLAKARWPLTVFAFQLALNASSSSRIFSGFHMPGAAFIEMVVLLVAIAATTIVFWRQSSLAAVLLMLQSLGRVAFATVWNLTIWRLNGRRERSSQRNRPLQAHFS